MPVAGNAIHQQWVILDILGAPLGGMTMPADIVAKLNRSTSTAIVAASETVSMSPIAGQTGYYNITFTPESSGIYFLELNEINANTLKRRWPFTYEIVSAGAVYLPSFANAFCAETDVERYLQKAIDANTSPSDSETAGFAQSRAVVLMSLCAGFGLTVTPATVTPASRLEGLLREANAIGAALDYELAQQLRVSPNRTERIDYFLGMWQQYYGPGPFEGTPGAKPPGPGYIEIEIARNLVSLATDHILSGDTAAPVSGGTPTDAGIQVGMGSVY